MTIAITKQDVNAFFGVETADHIVDAVIAVIDQADACLIGSEVPEASARLVKIYGVCHMLQMQMGGAVTSERSMTGDSVSYAAPTAGGTNWLAMLRSMSGGECITEMIDGSAVECFSVGRRN